MQQNINLLSSLPSITKILLSARQILQALGVWIIFLLIIVGINFIFMGPSNNIANLEIKRKNLSLQLESLATETALIIKNTKKISLTSNVATTIPSAILKTTGFSPFLDALAKYTPEGIGLENMIFSNLNFEVRLAGKALTESLLPEYLNILNNNPIFSDRNFTELTLQKEEKSRIVNFTLSTSREEKKEEKK